MALDTLGLKIIEVTDPYNLVETSSIVTGGSAKSVSSMKKDAKIYALVAARSGPGLKIIDITDP